MIGLATQLAALIAIGVLCAELQHPERRGLKVVVTFGLVVLLAMVQP